MTKLTEAIIFSAKAHDGQLDKGGVEYILHPLRVMDAMETDLERKVAVLHDVPEDTAKTLADIEHLFGKEVRDGVDAVTRRPNETYREYIQRCKLHPVGRKVKLADLADNSSPRRLLTMPENEQGIIHRYNMARAILLDE